MIEAVYNERGKNHRFYRMECTVEAGILLQSNKKNMICLREYEQAVFQGYKSR